MQFASEIRSKPVEKFIMTDLRPSAPSHTIAALILAAGKGTRMKSNAPKVLHSVLGRSMIEWSMDSVKKAGATDITLVLSSDVKPFERLISQSRDVRVTVQKNQKGTGDAVAAAAAAFKSAKAPSWSAGQLLSGSPSPCEWVLICAGDTPAMNPQTIREFITSTLASKKKLAVLGMVVPDPNGYGRLVCNKDNSLQKIVEERDADVGTKKIILCNSGVIFARVDWLFELLEGLSPNNSQNEYYLTDIFAASSGKGEPAYVFETIAAAEFAGVNDRKQLAAIEHSMLSRRLDELMSHGVTLHKPETIYIEADVVVEPDVTVFPGACLRGASRVARHCVIGHAAYLEDTTLGAGVQVGAHAVLIRSKVAAEERISPQASYADAEL